MRKCFFYWMKKYLYFPFCNFPQPPQYPQQPPAASTSFSCLVRQLSHSGEIERGCYNVTLCLRLRPQRLCLCRRRRHRLLYGWLVAAEGSIGSREMMKNQKYLWWETILHFNTQNSHNEDEDDDDEGKEANEVDVDAVDGNRKIFSKWEEWMESLQFSIRFFAVEQSHWIVRKMKRNVFS